MARMDYLGSDDGSDERTAREMGFEIVAYELAHGLARLDRAARLMRLNEHVVKGEQTRIDVGLVPEHIERSAANAFFGKRRHELASEHAGKQRAALQAYTPTSLNWALGITGTATVVTYVAYTLDPVTKAFFNTSFLWLTTPFTILGIVRFLLLVNGRVGRGLKAESPTQEMLRDVPMVLNVVLWIIVVVAVVYKLRPGGQ